MTKQNEDTSDVITRKSPDTFWFIRAVNGLKVSDWSHRIRFGRKWPQIWKEAVVRTPGTNCTDPGTHGPTALTPHISVFRRFKDFLNERTIQVRTEKCSGKFVVENGTLQGSIVSPSLFSIMIIFSRQNNNSSVYYEEKGGHRLKTEVILPRNRESKAIKIIGIVARWEVNMHVEKVTDKFQRVSLKKALRQHNCHDNNKYKQVKMLEMPQEPAARFKWLA